MEGGKKKKKIVICEKWVRICSGNDCRFGLNIISVFVENRIFLPMQNIRLDMKWLTWKWDHTIPSVIVLEHTKCYRRRINAAVFRSIIHDTVFMFFSHGRIIAGRLYLERNTWCLLSRIIKPEATRAWLIKSHCNSAQCPSKFPLSGQVCAADDKPSTRPARLLSVIYRAVMAASDVNSSGQQSSCCAKIHKETHVTPVRCWRAVLWSQTITLKKIYYILNR